MYGVKRIEYNPDVPMQIIAIEFHPDIPSNILIKTMKELGLIVYSLADKDEFDTIIIPNPLDSQFQWP